MRQSQLQTALARLTTTHRCNYTARHNAQLHKSHVSQLEEGKSHFNRDHTHLYGKQSDSATLRQGWSFVLMLARLSSIWISRIGFPHRNTCSVTVQDFPPRLIPSRACAQLRNVKKVARLNLIEYVLGQSICFLNNLWQFIHNFLWLTYQQIEENITFSAKLVTYYKLEKPYWNVIVISFIILDRFW